MARASAMLLRITAPASASIRFQAIRPSFRRRRLLSKATMAGKDLDVSKITVGSAKVSALAEMHSHVLEAADYAAPNAGWKERVTAAARILNLGWERAKGFYYGTARRVDAEEMDHARDAIRALREQRARAKADTIVGNLNRTLAYLRTVDPDGYSNEIAGLERALGRAGVLDRAVAEAAAEDLTTPTNSD